MELKLYLWDLSGKSKLKSRDLEWYFFSALDKKYGNSSRTNRATEKGYWKTTGKDRPVRHSARTVGMKKTLVYHIGRAPRGARTNWVMHEYKLTDEEMGKIAIVQVRIGRNFWSFSIFLSLRFVIYLLLENVVVIVLGSVGFFVGLEGCVCAV